MPSSPNRQRSQSRRQNRRGAKRSFLLSRHDSGTAWAAPGSLRFFPRWRLSERFQVPQVPSISMPAAESPSRLLGHRNLLLWLLLGTLLGVAGPGHVFAQGPDQATNPSTAADRMPAHSISGTLLDPSGAAIVKADVSLLGTKSEVLARTTTDGVGAFHLDNAASGKYRLTFHAER